MCVVEINNWDIYGSRFSIRKKKRGKKNYLLLRHRRRRTYANFAFHFNYCKYIYFLVSYLFIHVLRVVYTFIIKKPEIKRQLY